MKQIVCASKYNLLFPRKRHYCQFQNIKVVLNNQQIIFFIGTKKNKTDME